MASFTSLSNTETNEHHRRIFETLAAHENDSLTGDGAAEIALDSSELTLIRDQLYEVVRDGYEDGNVQSATDMKASLLLNTQEKMQAAMAAAQEAARMRSSDGIVKDGYSNPVSGIGTYLDPGMKTESFIPVSITPTEATAYYANGGVPARIIDKKAGCLMLDGLKFECAAFNADEITELQEYADKCGFSEAFREGVTQALIFGGSIVYPVLKGDTPLTMQAGIKELLENAPEKNFIKYWVNADRWNCVFVPEYNITAQDYLYARTVFIPLGGYRLNTRRAAMIRPRKLPFWGAIRQMGWSTSDFEGWIKDYESYEIMKMSLPVMAQQMSLMYHSFPADGLIIENGPEYVKQFYKQNEEELRNWSMLHPKTINSVGEIKILERTYSGFQNLISESRLALCSSASVPESILFAEKASGLASDNRDDIALKQSETIRLLFNNVAPCFQNCIELLVYSCFGKNSEQAKHAREVKIAPDNGIVLGDMEKAQLGQSFTQILGSLSAMGLPIDTGVDIAHMFIPSVEITDDIKEKLGAASAEIPQGMDDDMWNTINANREMGNGGY